MDIPILLEWKNILDILVISFILHRLFLLMRGTVAFQVTVGLVFLWLFQEVANAAGLVLTSWFFRGIGAVAVLVIVVVFRPEIRDILVHTNPIRFILGRSRQARAVGYPLIAQAVFRLAKRRTGALIVIQNQDDLRGNVRGGIALDANLVPEVLESIFSKESPVHDGAVIIRGNRIALAGTFLPLSQQEDLPQQFGTRHRAAIGLSEVCDAVILVVSEERGDISLVHRREVEPIRDPDQLERRLDFVLLAEDVSRSQVRKRDRAWLSHAGGLLLTFFLVSTFWGVYAGRQFSLMTLRAPVYYRNIPSDLQLKKASAEEVEVQVSGRRGLVSSLDPQQVRAFLNLARIDHGEHVLALKSDNIVLPPGLEVERITPSSITVDMERIIERIVQVEPVLVDPPPAGHTLEAVRVKPDSVRVRGPAAVLGDTTIVQTEPIVLRDLRLREGQAVLEAALELASPSVQLPDLDKGQVQVSIRFSQKEASPTEGAARPPEEAVQLTDKAVRYHRVREGDTLFEIGRRYGVKAETLRQLNRLKPGDFIYPGQELKIPKP
jgi:diadenylate cyclase